MNVYYIWTPILALVPSLVNSDRVSFQTVNLLLDLAFFFIKKKNYFTQNKLCDYDSLFSVKEIALTCYWGRAGPPRVLSYFHARGAARARPLSRMIP